MPQVIRGGAVGPIGVEAFQRTVANLGQTAQNFGQLGRDIQARRQAKQDVEQVPFEETLARFGGDAALVAMQQPEALYDYYKTMFGPVRAAREVAQKANQRLSPQGIATAAQLGILTGEILRSNPTLDVSLQKAKEAKSPAGIQKYANEETQRKAQFVSANPGASTQAFDTNIATANTLINNFDPVTGAYTDTANVPIMPGSKPLLKQMDKMGWSSWGVPAPAPAPEAPVGEAFTPSPQNSAEGAIPSGGSSDPMLQFNALLEADLQKRLANSSQYLAPQATGLYEQQPIWDANALRADQYKEALRNRAMSGMASDLVPTPYVPPAPQIYPPYTINQRNFGRPVMAAGQNFPVPHASGGSSIPGMEYYDEMTGGQDAHHLAAVGESEGIINAFAMRQPGVAEMVSKLNSQFANPAAPLAPKTVPQNGHDVQYEQDVMAGGKGLLGFLDKRAQRAGAENWQDAMANKQDYAQYGQAPRPTQQPMGGTGYRPTPGVVVGPGVQNIMVPQMYGAPVMAEGSSPKPAESAIEVDSMKEEESRIAHIIKLQELGNKTQDAQVKQMVLQNLNKLGWKTPFQASQVMAGGRVPVFAPGSGIAPGSNDRLDPYAKEKAKAIGFQEWADLVRAGKATAKDVPWAIRGAVARELDIPRRDFREQATGSPYISNQPIQGYDGLTLTKDDPGYVETRKAFPYSEGGAPPQVHPMHPAVKDFPAFVKMWQDLVNNGSYTPGSVPEAVMPYLGEVEVPYTKEPAYTKFEFVKPSESVKPPEPVVTQGEEKFLPEDEKPTDNKTKGQNVQAAKEANRWLARNARTFGGLNQSQISANFANLFMPEGVTIEDMASTTDRTIEAKQNRDRINEARRQFDEEMVLKWDQQNLDRETQRALAEAKGNVKSFIDQNPDLWYSVKTADSRQWDMYNDSLTEAKGDPVKARGILSAKIQADPDLMETFNRNNYIYAIMTGDPTASQWVEQKAKKEPGAIVNAWWNFRKIINNQFDATQAYEDFTNKEKNRGETIRMQIPTGEDPTDLSPAAFDAWKAKFGF